MLVNVSTGALINFILLVVLEHIFCQRPFFHKPQSNLRNMLPLWSPWEKEEGRCSGERGAAGVQARQRQWPSARCSSFGLLHAKNITNGPQALFRRSWRQLFGIRDSDSYWSAELLCFLTGLPASSPFLDLPPSCVASLCKNHQWSCIAYTWNLTSLVGVQSSSCPASTCLSVLPPEVSHWAPYPHTIWNTTWFLFLCGLVCSYWLWFPGAPSLLDQLLFSLKSPSEMSPPVGSLLWSSLSSTSSFSTFFIPRSCVILSVIHVSQLLQARDRGVPSLCLITQFCVWHVVGHRGM